MTPGRRYDAGPVSTHTRSTMSDVQQRIDEMVKGHKVMLFMKGTAQFLSLIHI